ncbi:phosphate ABC transporter membrane protein 1, PhoT family (TC 3.A.1.7.1) [Streptococcus gallolyticus]|uniref:Phosphate transport system permease protein n=1 Tax=Streptococcus gallolyticus TaxID=315405 RepID=A0A1H7VPA9_9STRE|nr:phosphate ABC transporter permease subunit PstC [Streptococcus gallolyticus]MCQ9216373.1 phosphate ABC transporter permease subunit PstC [Streptococcus gallolyticus]MCY7186467.1 phosphate ABC transporter permease subunit PstC [Streptococcus gallolyticus subsp. gallolyticus]SDK07246.1 phosphate ABC transporter membrane protein 1, PhoT family (TC 3.A.1.7.1) [Streptococcus gallolyticus]SDL56922.1 phosphate ABC transporter membrane protein 1, PhoT family (TC 3.A.1.7.1) [Streptococcus gallolyticu
MNHKSEKVMQAVFFLTACISIVSVLLICIFLFSNGLPAIKEIGITKFLFGEVWRPSSNEFGILPMIVGSLYVTLGALVIGVPIGILTAVFMAYFCPNKLYKPLKAGINLMAGIPSVVYGFFGLVVLVPFVRDYIGGYGMGVLTAAILLGIMILPTIVSVSETAIRAVPHHYYEGGLALGASHERSIFFVVLPAAKRGLLAAIILGLGRAVGETMAVIMVAGNQAILPKALTSGVRTLTTNIVMEMGYSTGLHREALIGTAVVLFIFVLIINICFSLLHKEE